MKKKTFTIAVFTVTFILICTLLSVSVFAEDGSWAVKSATRQDPGNTVLIWTAEKGCSYQIYRSDKENGKYELIGKSDTSSFIDTRAAYPKAYWYKVSRNKGGTSEFSLPVKTGTNPQPLNAVPVIMYHNFVTAQDIKSGIPFDEYALDPSDFEADLAWLKANGYSTITSADLIRYIHGEQPLPKKAVIISIDDASWGVYTNAWPLLKKYNMKADLNIIGRSVDNTWDDLHAGGTRDGNPEPYCTWEEIIAMVKSGEINPCSHTYGFHRKNNNGRTGCRMKDGETAEEFAEAVIKDYKKVTGSITGWTHVVQKTMAYPYSKRTPQGDSIILENTGYEILMAGDSARGTDVNYFVEGADENGYVPLMSRPCRMDGHPISEYLDEAFANDAKNGVNGPEDISSLSVKQCENIAKYYSPFKDVAGTAWYAGSVYYGYVNSVMTGTSASRYSPEGTLTRGTVATLLYRLAGRPSVKTGSLPADIKTGQWYADPALWAVQNKIMETDASGKFRPDEVISRESLALCLYNYAIYKHMDTSASASLDRFKDASRVSEWAVPAFEWAVAVHVFNGGDGKLMPKNSLTRAQMVTVLQNWDNAF